MKIRIGWSELAHFQKTVEMTSEEFQTWQKKLDEKPRSKLQLFDEQKLALVQADDWDEIEIDTFEPDGPSTIRETLDRDGPSEDREP